MGSLSVKLWKDKAFLNGDFADIRRIAIELPGYKKFINDSLLFEPSGKNIEHLLKEDIEWKGEASELANDHRARLRKEKESIETKHSEIQIMDFKFKTEPFAHQLKAFFLSRDAEYYGYFMEMGTGKTKVVIDNSADLFDKNKIDCLIILAPNGVHSQWINEQLPMHMPERCNARGLVYRATDKKSLKALDEVLDGENFEGLTVVAFNIDALSNDKGRKYIEKFLRKFRCLFVIDESVRIKTPGSARTKAALKLAPLAPYRRIMSGAPVTKGYEDIYAQLKFLHPDVLGFNSFYTFRNYHCIMGGFESRQIVGYRPNAIKELEQKIEAYTFRVTKKECLDLPEKIYVNRYVDLTREQEELYSKIEDELAIDMRYINEVRKNADNLTAAEKQEIDTSLMSAITKMLRLQQIVCGHFVKTDDEGKVEQIIDLPNNRIDQLFDCINEAQGKIIIWSRFIHDLKKISHLLNKNNIMHRTYHGEVSQINRENAIECFKTDPNCKVFLAQPASGGTGLNLAVADTVIYYSNDFNADTRWQSEDRAHRIGQKNNVTYIDFITLKTIDEDILDSLKQKKNLADALLDNPRKFLKRG